MLTATLRPIRDADWPGVVALEAAAYNDLGLSENPDHLRSRAGAGTSFILEAGGGVAGYVLALPLAYGRVPHLHGPGEAAEQRTDLHLHDLVVDPAHRRLGMGSRLVAHLLMVAGTRRYERISLVSVGGSGAFWTRHGFRPRAGVPGIDDYGPGATYMSRTLRP